MQLFYDSFSIIIISPTFVGRIKKLNWLHEAPRLQFVQACILEFELKVRRL